MKNRFIYLIVLAILLVASCGKKPSSTTTPCEELQNQYRQNLADNDSLSIDYLTHSLCFIGGGALTEIPNGEVYRLQYIYGGKFKPRFYRASTIYVTTKQMKVEETGLIIYNRDSTYISHRSSSEWYNHNDMVSGYQDSLLSKINKAQFWNLSDSCSYCLGVGDGFTYVLEGWKDGEYNIVVRDVPREMARHVSEPADSAKLTAFADLCEYIEKMGH